MSDNLLISDFDFRPEPEPASVPEVKPSFDDKAIEKATELVYETLSQKIDYSDPLIEAAQENPYSDYEFTPKDVFDYNVSNAIRTKLLEIDDEDFLTEMDAALHEGRLKALGGMEMITATIYQKLLQDPKFLSDLNRDNMWEKFLEARRCYRRANKLVDDDLRIFDTPIRQPVKPQIPEHLLTDGEDDDPRPIVATMADDPFRDFEIKEIPEDASNYRFHEVPKWLTLAEHRAFTNKYGCKDKGHNGSQRPYAKVCQDDPRDLEHDLVCCDRRFLKKYLKFVEEKKAERKRKPMTW